MPLASGAKSIHEDMRQSGTPYVKKRLRKVKFRFFHKNAVKLFLLS